ncbi:glycoside hydrolase family 5 protein [Acetobacter sp. UBA5411]|uniref:glycoside hydrolase family 5 protein n=1 Tax=Acetobacter sp. UBA5411 TaxID=1945905 RepID=UPI0025B87280|nr:glycoside hydrolase family 5 protein [Acetobacter sp. UBA5411]
MNLIRFLSCFILGASCLVADKVNAAPVAGINLSAAAFASGRVPGRDGWDYMFPRQGEVDYFTAAGMKLIRLPVLWERLQPQPLSGLDPRYLAHIQSVVAMAKAGKAKVIIDLHNYGAYHGQLIGSDAVKVDDFVDVWVKLVRVFANDPHVLFGLMNEPKLASAGDWASIQQKVINAIRATGAKNLITVSGVQWDGAHNFPQVNGDALATLTDPRHGLIFEAHQYFDRDSSGRSAECVPENQVEGRLRPFTDWLKAHKAKGLLGEFGVSDNAGCLADLRVALNFINQTSDVWYGWTYWAGGPMWGNYMYSVQPGRDGVEKPQMAVLKQFAARSH